jgi:hypothetical protein
MVVSIGWGPDEKGGAMLCNPRLRGSSRCLLGLVALTFGVAVQVAGLSGAAAATVGQGCGDWQAVKSPYEPSGNNELYGVAAIAHDDVWTSGVYYEDREEKALIMHWDGDLWTIVPTPSASESDYYLPAIDAIAADDVWAVGYFDDADDLQRTLVEHWNGSAWVIVPSPNGDVGDNYLDGVAVISSNDVWAVGRSSTEAGVHHTLTMHWDGSTWTIVPSPDIGSRSNTLLGVGALSSTDVWAVGRYLQSDDPRDGNNLVLHWDGAAWALVPSTPGSRNLDGLFSVSPISAEDVWAVGRWRTADFTPRTLAEHWDGRAWSIVSTPNLGQGLNDLFGVAAISSSDVWAVGEQDAPPGMPRLGLIQHWNGTAWRLVKHPNPSHTGDNDLNAVDATAGGETWAVGYTGPNKALLPLTLRYCPV